jgi:signal transduction histidine kinase
MPAEKSPFSSAQDLNIYRIVQEAIQNAVKHSQASLIQVEVRAQEENIIISVKDNGCGNSSLYEEKPGIIIDKHKIRGGLGLRSMRYRARQLDAEYIIESSETDGTKVEIRI